MEEGKRGRKKEKGRREQETQGEGIGKGRGNREEGTRENRTWQHVTIALTQKRNNDRDKQ